MKNLRNLFIVLFVILIFAVLTGCSTLNKAAQFEMKSIQETCEAMQIFQDDWPFYDGLINEAMKDEWDKMPPNQAVKLKEIIKSLNNLTGQDMIDKRNCGRAIGVRLRGLVEILDNYAPDISKMVTKFLSVLI